VATPRTRTAGAFGTPAAVSYSGSGAGGGLAIEFGRQAGIGRNVVMAPGRASRWNWVAHSFRTSLAGAWWICLRNPLGNIALPRVKLIDNSWLYDAASFPLHFVALIPPLDDIVFFAGEGPIAVRPFCVFLFWFLVGVCCLWLSYRRKPKPAAS
jgi:hypothetical protein